MATIEFMRLEETIAASGVEGEKADPEAVQLRLDILTNRLNIWNDGGEFEEFASHDPDNVAVIRSLADVIRQVQPLVASLNQPSAIKKALEILAPLDPKLAGLAAKADRFSSDKEAADQRELIKLHWIFTGIATCLLLSGLILLFTLWRAYAKLHLLAEHLRFVAEHDGLTGLVNRKCFHDQLEPALTRAGQQGSNVAVICLDLDGFKEVNDTYGHPIGDALLVEVAARLQKSSCEGDVVARLGGDEFAVLQTNVGGAEECRAVAARLIVSLTQPFYPGTSEVNISASGGIAIAPFHGSGADDLMKNADMALYRAKSDGSGSVQIFETELAHEAGGRLILRSELRRALEQEHLELYFQPIVDQRGLFVTGFEALLRWKHPVRGMISPAEFIPIAEKDGLIGTLGEWVLRQACLHATAWPSDLSVAVNLSPVQFKDGNLLDMVRRVLGQTGLSPARLELEITEAVLLHNTFVTLNTLHELRAMGIRISMDDFGTGYSSLSYLTRFPFDTIKIDQSFVRELSSRPECIKIVRSVAALGASLGMTVTAEGVETPEQLEHIRSAGCHKVQGYLFGRAQPPDELDFAPRQTEGLARGQRQLKLVL